MRGKGNEMEGDDFAINFPLTGLLPDATEDVFVGAVEVTSKFGQPALRNVAMLVGWRKEQQHVLSNGKLSSIMEVEQNRTTTDGVRSN